MLEKKVELKMAVLVGGRDGRTVEGYVVDEKRWADAVARPLRDGTVCGDDRLKARAAVQISTLKLTYS